MPKKRKRVAPDLKNREQERQEEFFKLFPAARHVEVFYDEDNNTRYFKPRELFIGFPWRFLAITLVIVMVGGVGLAATQARIVYTQRYIAAAEQQLMGVQSEIIVLRENLAERYTHYEIERIASERLGMSMPDPAQIFDIYVPRVGGVVMNIADYAIPRHNYFWEEIVNFISGIFGGNRNE